jgi:hypothetical protein
VPVPKGLKIDLSSEYPCPCRRNGRIEPIMLTEAFGCNRCQQIFVVKDNDYQLEQLSSTYPYKRAWRWNGHRWIAVHSRWGELYLPLSLGIMVVMLVVWLPLTLQSSVEVTILFWALLAVLLALLPAIIVWLAHWRS